MQEFIRIHAHSTYIHIHLVRATEALKYDEICIYRKKERDEAPKTTIAKTVKFYTDQWKNSTNNKMNSYTNTFSL